MGHRSESARWFNEFIGFSFWRVGLRLRANGELACTLRVQMARRVEDIVLRCAQISESASQRGILYPTHRKVRDGWGTRPLSMIFTSWFFICKKGSELACALLTQMAS